MASLREIRRKIKSVKSTEQITKAMKMVAAARMRRAQSSIVSSRPFAVKMEGMVRALRTLESAGGMPAHPFFAARQGPDILLLVTADKGLCGAFNSNLLRAALDWLKAAHGRKTCVAIVGRKGRDFVQRIKAQYNVEILIEVAGIFPKVSFTHAELIGSALIEAYEKQGAGSVTVLYNEFKSVASQNLVKTTLLPIAQPIGAGDTLSEECGFEPDRGVLLARLLPRHIKAQIYRILLESQAAELAARMNAMDAASSNAQELRAELNLNANRQRQAMITKEIAELVSGAEALAA